MMVVDQTDDVSTRVLDRGDDNAVAHVLWCFEACRAVRFSVGHRLGYVILAPVGRGAGVGLVRGHETEFVARDLEAAQSRKRL